MCYKYMNCEFCGFHKEICEYFGDGRSCHDMFFCISECNSNECFSYDFNEMINAHAHNASGEKPEKSEKGRNKVGENL